MKKYFIILLIALLPLSVFAQNCGGYYYLQDHSEIQMTSYDRDGKPSVVVTSRITGVSSIPGGIKSNFQTTVKDKDGQLMDQGQGTMKCLHGNLSVDMRQSMPSGSMKQFQNMRVKADEAYIVYPADMRVGQALPDASYHMEIYKNESDKRFATIDYTVSKRKVAGKEQVTTPAGSWNCFKITSSMTMKITIGIAIPMRFEVTEWFAPDFGIVKTEDDRRNGKQVGSMELTRIKK